MRRAVQAIVISGMLLSAAACSTATSGPTPGSAPQPPGAPGAPGAASATRTGDPADKSSCEALSQVYNKNMAPFAEAVTRMVDARERAADDQDHEQRVRQSLTTFATAITGATKDSADPRLRTDGKKTAEQLTAKAADAEFIGGIKTTKDANTVLGPTLKGWLSPVAQHCS
jgi:hypothetical protein